MVVRRLKRRQNIKRITKKYPIQGTIILQPNYSVLTHVEGKGFQNTPKTDDIILNSP
jgi:hypothetical protein